MTLKIIVRPAEAHETLNIDDNAERLPKGVDSYDGSDWEYHFLCGLHLGNWVVTIEDPDGILAWQGPGIFHVEVDEEQAGCVKKVE